MAPKGINPRNMHDLAGSGTGPATPATETAAAETAEGAAARGQRRPRRQPSAGRQLFLGTFIHSRTREALEYLHDTAVFVDEAGTIVAVERECDARGAEERVYPRLGWTTASVTVTACKEGQFFFPGFIGEYQVPPCPSIHARGKISHITGLAALGLDGGAVMGGGKGEEVR